MLRKKFFGSIILAGFAVMLAMTLTSCLTSATRSRTRYLMITANTFEARLLAELAQYRTSQPVLLYDAPSDKFYFLSGKKEVTTVESAEFGEFVDFLNPRQVLVLGDAKFVPEKYVTQAAEKFPMITVGSEDWNKNAMTLGRILKVNRIARDFRDTRERFIKSGVLQGQ